ncbi:ISNCY family transposase [Chloroflexota bacterium]
MSVMKGLTLTEKEQGRLQTLNFVLGGQIGVGEAAYILGLSERQTWRILAAYKENGAKALSHGNHGRQPPNATSAMIRERIVALVRERYQDINHTHLTELLEERECIVVSRSTVRRLLMDAGLASPRHRQSRHRYRRMRMPQEGMLLQVDGSHHRWLEERGPWLNLLLAVDDATGTVPYALFRDREDAEGYFRLLKGVIQQHGIPLALYSDRHVVFRKARPSGETEESSLPSKPRPTQFGRAMRELGVTQIFARSPEAKGRVERANGTFQDRLVAELRLANASTLAEANRVLESFLPRFNQRFGVPAAQPELVYRTVDPGLDIDAVLCNKEMRRVAKDNTVQYHGKTLQIFPGVDRSNYAGARVEVQERLDGHLLVSCKGKILTPREAPPLADKLRNCVDAYQANGGWAKLMEEAFHDPIPKKRVLGARKPVGLGWEGFWYENEDRKRSHRDLVLAGMERARLAGKHIGRPRVTSHEGFLQHFREVVSRIGQGDISRNQAARELGIGYATLKRLLDANSGLPKESNDNGDRQHSLSSQSIEGESLITTCT